MSIQIWSSMPLAYQRSLKLFLLLMVVNMLFLIAFCASGGINLVPIPAAVELNSLYITNPENTAAQVSTVLRIDIPISHNKEESLGISPLISFKSRATGANINNNLKVSHNTTNKKDENSLLDVIAADIILITPQNYLVGDNYHVSNALHDHIVLYQSLSKQDDVSLLTSKQSSPNYTHTSLFSPVNYTLDVSLLPHPPSSANTDFQKPDSFILYVALNFYIKNIQIFDSDHNHPVNLTNIIPFITISCQKSLIAPQNDESNLLTPTMISNFEIYPHKSKNNLQFPLNLPQNRRETGQTGRIDRQFGMLKFDYYNNSGSELSQRQNNNQNLSTYRQSEYSRTFHDHSTKAGRKQTIINLYFLIFKVIFIVFSIAITIVVLGSLILSGIFCRSANSESIEPYSLNNSSQTLEAPLLYTPLSLSNLPPTQQNNHSYTNYSNDIPPQWGLDPHHSILNSRLYLNIPNNHHINSLNNCLNISDDNVASYSEKTSFPAESQGELNEPLLNSLDDRSTSIALMTPLKS